MEKTKKPGVITISYEGKEYILDFSRESVRYAERHGFKIADAENYPLTATEDIFFYGLRMHQSWATRELANELIDKLGGVAEVSEITARLAELYLYAFTSLKDPNVKVTMG